MRGDKGLESISAFGLTNRNHIHQRIYPGPSITELRLLYLSVSEPTIIVSSLSYRLDHDSNQCLT